MTSDTETKVKTSPIIRRTLNYPSVLVKNRYVSPSKGPRPGSRGTKTFLSTPPLTRVSKTQNREGSHLGRRLKVPKFFLLIKTNIHSSLQ